MRHAGPERFGATPGLLSAESSIALALKYMEQATYTAARAPSSVSCPQSTRGYHACVRALAQGQSCPCPIISAAVPTSSLPIAKNRQPRACGRTPSLRYPSIDCPMQHSNRQPTTSSGLGIGAGQNIVGRYGRGCSLYGRCLPTKALHGRARRARSSTHPAHSRSCGR